MKLSDFNLSEVERENILRENWFSHDARWFLKILEEYGIETANRLNRVVLKSMAKTEMKRIMLEFKIDQVKDIGEFKKIWEFACELYFPSSMFDIKFNVLSENQASVLLKKCYIFDSVKQAGVTEIYECPCNLRIRGHLEACNLKGDVVIKKSMLKKDNFCELLISLV